MKYYTFTGPKGVTTTVGASSETEARELAMVERWGPVSYPLIGPYTGMGLDLMGVSTEAPPPPPPTPPRVKPQRTW
jgi:hypothetical protein